MPGKPSIIGSNRENVFVLRNINDMKSMKMYINLNKCRKAAIIGSGPIGLEMAEALTKMNLKTTLFARSTISKGLIPEMNARVEKHLLDHGVDVVSNAAIDKIEEKGVSLTNGKLYAADIVLLAAGVKPVVELAKSVKIKIGTTGAIAVDQYMKTSDPDIYACGDCAEYFHSITGALVYRPLGSTANKTGIIAGNHIVGGTDKFQGRNGKVDCLTYRCVFMFLI